MEDSNYIILLRGGPCNFHKWRIVIRYSRYLVVHVTKQNGVSLEQFRHVVVHVTFKTGAFTRKFETIRNRRFVSINKVLSLLGGPCNFQKWRIVIRYSRYLVVHVTKQNGVSLG